MMPVSLPYLRIEYYNSAPPIVKHTGPDPGFAYLIIGRTIVRIEPMSRLIVLKQLSAELAKELGQLRIDCTGTMIHLQVPNHEIPIVLWPK